jgi:hypothetical protein
MDDHSAVTANPPEVITSAARQVAHAIAPYLEARLRAVDGPDWLAAVNARRAIAGFPPGRGLRDHRFCLAVLAFDPAMQGWVDECWRRDARELVLLANKAVHDENLNAIDAERATAIARLFVAWQDSPAGEAPLTGPGAKPHDFIGCWEERDLPEQGSSRSLGPPVRR